MEKYFLMVCCVYSGFVTASENEALLSSWGRDNTSWVSFYQNNPNEYLSINPDKSHELYNYLVQNGDDFNEESFRLGKKQIMDHYIAVLHDFETEFTCSRNNAFGYGATLMLAGIEGVGSIFLFERANSNCYAGSQSKLQWPQMCTANWIVASLTCAYVVLPTIAAGVMVTNWRQRQLLKKKLFERGDHYLITMYQAVKKLDGDNNIRW